jgi:hypothetical protein
MVRTHMDCIFIGDPIVFLLHVYFILFYLFIGEGVDHLS